MPITRTQIEGLTTATRVMLGAWYPELPGRSKPGLGDVARCVAKMDELIFSGTEEGVDTMRQNAAILNLGRELGFCK